LDRYVYASSSACRPCKQANNARSNAVHRERKHAGDKAYRLGHSEEVAAKGARWRKAHPEKLAEYTRKFRLANPEKTHLWYKRSPDVQRGANVVSRAIKKGLLTRPAECEECRKACKPEAAHRDYARPLDVRWLCRSCHRRWDRAEPKSAYSRARKEAGIA
jgi:hypothetical protein